MKIRRSQAELNERATVAMTEAAISKNTARCLSICRCFPLIVREHDLV